MVREYVLILDEFKFPYSRELAEWLNLYIVPLGNLWETDKVPERAESRYLLELETSQAYLDIKEESNADHINFYAPRKTVVFSVICVTLNSEKALSSTTKAK